MSSHLKCEISRSNPRGSTRCRLRSSALGSRATVVLKGKSRVTQRYPQEVLRRDDREGTTDVTVVLGLCSLSVRVIEITEVELLVSVVRQGKETVHLDGNHSDLVGRQGRQRCYWWSWLPSLTVSRLSRGNDNGCRAS